VSDSFPVDLVKEGSSPSPISTNKPDLTQIDWNKVAKIKKAREGGANSGGGYGPEETLVKQSDMSSSEGSPGGTPRDRSSMSPSDELPPSFDVDHGVDEVSSNPSSPETERPFKMDSKPFPFTDTQASAESAGQFGDPWAPSSYEPPSSAGVGTQTSYPPAFSGSSFKFGGQENGCYSDDVRTALLRHTASGRLKDSIGELTSMVGDLESSQTRLSDERVQLRPGVVIRKSAPALMKITRTDALQSHSGGDDRSQQKPKKDNPTEKPPSMSGPSNSNRSTRASSDSSSSKIKTVHDIRGLSFILEEEKDGDILKRYQEIDKVELSGLTSTGSSLVRLLHTANLDPMKGEKKSKAFEKMREVQYREKFLLRLKGASLLPKDKRDAFIIDHLDVKVLDRGIEFDEAISFGETYFGQDKRKWNLAASEELNFLWKHMNAMYDNNTYDPAVRKVYYRMCRKGDVSFLSKTLHVKYDRGLPGSLSAWISGIATLDDELASSTVDVLLIPVMAFRSKSYVKETVTTVDIRTWHGRFGSVGFMYPTILPLVGFLMSHIEIYGNSEASFSGFVRRAHANFSDLIRR